MEKADNVLLAQAANEGDREAIGALHVKYYNRIKSYIRLRVHREQEAEDLAQSVFVELCRGNMKYDAQSDPQAYLLGVAKNLIVRHIRRRKRQPRLIQLGSAEEFAGRIPAAPSQCPHKLLLDELGKVLAEIGDRPSTKADEALVLRFVHGLSVKEAAQRAGCSTSAFYERLYYAMDKLGRQKGSLVSRVEAGP
ncbi:MAG: sigma-70 family RNA polymerase sigma factor [Phycisphaerales bacterium]|nr:MAG: sigma-70 family RNA polymerase sigma factor [Phycisphaerales bacterium]